MGVKGTVFWLVVGWSGEIRGKYTDFQEFGTNWGEFEEAQSSLPS